MSLINRMTKAVSKMPNEHYRNIMQSRFALMPSGIPEFEERDIELAEKMLLRMMDNNLHNIPRAFETARERKWDKIFVFVDIHDTVLCPDYASVAKIYEPMAKEVLKKISDRKDMCLCLYTCSYPLEIRDYTDHFEKDGIIFEHINENSEAKNTKHGYFREKPYMNVLLEDKAGFDAKIDWYIIDQLLEVEPILEA